MEGFFIIYYYNIKMLVIEILSNCPHKAVVVQPQLMAINGGAYRYMQNPALIVCQHCQATVTTSLSYEVGLLTYAISGLMCLFG